MKSNAAFADRLREAIRRKGMSQTELARQLSVRDATVSEWLNHGTVPNGTVMLRLPEILAVDGHWLLTGETKTPTGREIPDPTQVTEAERAQVATLLEVALRLLKKERATSEPEVAGNFLRVRGAGEDEALDLQAVERFARRRAAPQRRKRSTEGRGH